MTTARNKFFFCAGVLLLLAAPAARADSFTFSTIPANGAIPGPPGATIGWGYSITNNSQTDYVEFSALSSDSFLNGTPLAIFDFPIIAPGATIMVPFDPINVLGLYQLTWDATAPVGFTNSGTFLLTGDFCTDSACASMISNSALTQSALYSATVTVPVTVTPEPTSVTLVAAGLVAGLLRGSRRRTQRQ
jgi:hypothetical protein